MVDDDPVDLLGHLAVEAPKARLDVGDRDAQASSAQSAAASVELTSPGTTTRSGRSSRRTGSRRSITRAACSPCEPEPTPSMWSGSGTPSSEKKTSDIARS